MALKVETETTDASIYQYDHWWHTPSHCSRTFCHSPLSAVVNLLTPAQDVMSMSVRYLYFILVSLQDICERFSVALLSPFPAFITFFLLHESNHSLHISDLFKNREPIQESVVVINLAFMLLLFIRKSKKQTYMHNTSNSKWVMSMNKK